MQLEDDVPTVTNSYSTNMYVSNWFTTNVDWVFATNTAYVISYRSDPTFDMWIRNNRSEILSVLSILFSIILVILCIRSMIKSRREEIIHR